MNNNEYWLRESLTAAHRLCTSTELCECDHALYDHYMNELEYRDIFAYREIAEMVNHMFELKHAGANV